MFESRVVDVFCASVGRPDALHRMIGTARDSSHPTRVLVAAGDTATIEVCDGSVALAFDSLDDPTVVATGGWVWQGFGFTVPAELVGTGRPGCIDVDGDGRLDPVIVDRS